MSAQLLYVMTPEMTPEAQLIDAHAAALKRRDTAQGTAFLERTLARHLSNGGTIVNATSNGSLLQRPSSTQSRSGQPSLSASRLPKEEHKEAPRGRSPRLALHESTLKEMSALLEASAARQGEALQRRFDTLETRLSSRFEQNLAQQLEKFRAAHMLPLATQLSALNAKLDDVLRARESGEPNASIGSPASEQSGGLPGRRSASRSSTMPAGSFSFSGAGMSPRGGGSSAAETLSFRRGSGAVETGSFRRGSASVGAPPLRSQSPSLCRPGVSADAVPSAELTSELSSMAGAAASSSSSTPVEEATDEAPSGEAPSHPSELWALIGNDAEVRSMLKDARKHISTFAERADRSITRRLGLAAAARTRADDSEVGTLHVHVSSAANLKAGDNDGLSDPYVKLSLNGEHRKSRTIKKTLHPVWEETFSFSGTLGTLVREHLRLVVMDYDALSSDDLLGNASVDLAGDWYPTGERSFSVSLDTQGTVFLQAWWHADEALVTSLADESTSFRASASKAEWLTRGRKKCCSARVWCRSLTGRVMHPDSRFRSGWNVGLAFLICCTVRNASHHERARATPA